VSLYKVLTGKLKNLFHFVGISCTIHWCL